VATILLAFPSI